MEKSRHIAIVASPWFSIQASIIEFSKRLIQRSTDLHVTCLIPTLGSLSDATKAILQTLPSRATFTLLPPILYGDPPQGTPKPPLLFGHTVTRSLPYIRDALQSISSSSSSRLVAMVVDFFASDALICAKELNMLSFVYFPSSAMTLSFFLHFPKLDQTEIRDLSEPIEIPGCVPILSRDLPKSIQDRTSQMYAFFLQRCQKLHVVDGIMVNSFKDIEEGPIRALKEEGSGYPSVYPVGPILQSVSGNDTTNGCECLRWLENQVPNSVLYVSFGSGGTLSQDQLNELALGLEISGQKFLWAVRAPSESANSAHLNFENGDPLRFLPNGFIDRTKGQGLVVSSWAPQVQVLSHNAIGGFLSHCGWNSTLESIMNGVPLIAWPLFAEQGMNAVLLTDGLEVALRPKADENGLVERGEVAMVVRRLIEGEEGREIGRRMQKLKDAAVETLQEEGSSTKTLIQLAVYLMSN
ncbi:hydroquinone glucosyltransferase-like [Abrus precatorius]|uniref:Glycosyltransferase n=1 Tax=Abrus precatorius TaxID=3816 RepID=A0A8B8JZY0_ABRPR|nr:hydroquinone glucosyltransferase-like [Abrus precatorius]